MSAIEQEIMTLFRKLDQEARLRVLSSMERDQVTESLSEALQAATEFRESLRQKYGQDHHFGTQDLLDELREESSWHQS